MNTQKINSLIKLLKLDSYGGNYGRKNYVIDLNDDSEWGKVYTILDSTPELDQIEENVLLTEHNSSLLYNYNDELLLNLKADFDNDQYQLVISEI